MTFKEFHILNENNKDAEPIIKDYIKNIDKNIDLNEIFKKTDDGVVWADKAKEKYQDIVKKLEEIINDNNYKPAKKDIVLTKSVFGNRFKELKDLKEDLGTVGDNDTEHNDPNSGDAISGNDSIEKDSDKQKTEPGDEKIVDNFFANKDFMPKVSNNYSSFKIEGSNFLQKSLNLNDYGILYSAIKNFGIKPEQIKEIKEIVSLLKDAAEKDSDSKLSLEEYVSAMKKLSTPTNANGAGKSLAKEPNIVKFVLFLAKLHTIHNENFPTAARIISKKTVERFLTDENDKTRKENESLLYSFFTINNNNLAPNTSTIFGEILSELSRFNISFQLDDVLNDKMSTLKQIDDFVKNPPEAKPEAKPEEKKPEKEGLASRVRGQYLSKRITDNKRNLDRYDRETEKLKDDGSYSKLSDYNQAGKAADKETYGFNIDKPTADEDSINNFEERITHLFQNEILNITGALRIKGIAGERSEANRKNNAISRTWEEAIMRSNNKILIEGFFDNRLKDTKYALRDIKNKALKNFTDDNKAEDTPDSNGEYTSNAENRANDIFKDYMQRGKDIIGRYVKKMHDASRKVEAGKTYAQRVNKEWSITKAYYDLLRKLFDLKLACRDACEEGGLTKIKNKIGKFTERFTGDKEYREKNAISNADAVKKVLEKQIVNVKGPNDLQVIAKLSLFDILFNSKSAEEAINKINNGDFEGIGLNNVKDFSGQAKRGSPLNLSNPSAVYNKPAQLFKVIGVNAAEITEDGLTQLQKSLNKEDCLAQVNKFKNIVEKVMEKITPKTSISLENLFLKKGFVLKEDAQSLAAAKDNAEKIFAQGIDLTDIVSMLDDSSWIPFRQAIGGNVLVTGKKAGKEISLLFTKNGFKAAKNAQEKLGEEEVKNKQQQQQQQANALNNNNVADTLADNKPNATYWNSDASVVTTNAADSTYGNGYQKQTPQSRMKEIIYKKGNYTVKTRQMI